MLSFSNKKRHRRCTKSDLSKVNNSFYEEIRYQARTTGIVYRWRSKSNIETKSSIANE